MAAGTIELAEGGDRKAKRAFVPRSSAKPVSLPMLLLIKKLLEAYHKAHVMNR